MSSNEQVLAMSSPPTVAPARPQNLLDDIAAVFVSPGPLFDEITVRNRGARALIVLVALQFCYAWAVMKTGIIDYEIDVATQAEVSRMMRDQGRSENEQQLNAQIDGVEKWSGFKKMLKKLDVLFGTPAQTIVKVNLIAGVFFAAIALSGGKPKFDQLASVAIYASFVELPRMLLKLYLITTVDRLRVETSVAALFSAGEGIDLWSYLLLRRLDPFDIWFWALVGYGVWKIGQAKPRLAASVTVMLAIIYSGSAIGVDIVDYAEMPQRQESDSSMFPPRAR